MLTLLSITELKHSSFFCSFLLSTLCIVGFANNCMAVLNALCQRLLDYYTSYYCFPVFSVVIHLCLLKNNKHFYPFCTFTSSFCLLLQAVGHRPRSRWRRWARWAWWGETLHFCCEISDREPPTGSTLCSILAELQPPPAQHQRHQQKPQVYK